MIVCTAFCEICAASSPATLKRLRRFVCGKGVLLLRFGRRMTVIGELTTAKRLAHEAVQADSEGDRPEDALRLYSRCTRIISEVVGRGDLGLSEANVEELRSTLRQYTERSEQLKLRLVREGKVLEFFGYYFQSPDVHPHARQARQAVEPALHRPVPDQAPRRALALRRPGGRVVRQGDREHARHDCRRRLIGRVPRSLSFVLYYYPYLTLFGRKAYLYPFR